MQNAVIYARYSSQGQNEQSIEGQVRICKEYAESKGFNIVKTYIDKARTGTNDQRPDFQKMVREAASGAFQNILVYKFDRFARSRFDSMMYKQQLKKQYGIRVISALEPVSDDEGGEIYEMFLEWNDEKYSQRLSVRVRDGLTTSIENGTYTGQHLIYGYKLIDTEKMGKKGKPIHRVAIDEEQVPVVKFIFEEYAKGAGKKEIAAALNAKGHKFKGEPFKGRTFDKWLANEKYTGEFIIGGRVCGNMFPQIIDKALFAEVQKRLVKNKILAGANSAIEPYLLTGKAFCGHCDTAVVSDGGTGKTGKKHYYYACKKMKKGGCNKKRVNKDALELFVIKCVKDFLSDPKNADIAASDVIAYYEQRTGDDGLKSIETRITNARKEVEDLTNAFIEAKSGLLRASIEKKMPELEILLHELTLQKSRIELERGLKVTKQHILSFVAELLKGNENDKEYQRKIIDNLVYRVYIYDEHYVVYLNLNGGQSVEQVSLQDTNNALTGVLGVQTQSPLAHQLRIIRTFTSLQAALQLPISCKIRIVQRHKATGYSSRQ